MIEIEALRREVAALRDEVARLRVSQSARPPGYMQPSLLPISPIVVQPYYPGGPIPATC